MKKLLVLMAFLVVSCGDPGSVAPVPVISSSPVASVTPSPTPTPTVTPTSSPTPTPSVSPTPAPSLPTIVVSAITGTTGDEDQMIQQGIDDVNAVLATQCFHDLVVSDTTFTETQGLTSQGIWDLISTHPAVVTLTMYTGTWWANHVYHTVAYEDNPDVANLNRYYVNNAFIVGDALIHEAEGHSQGFTHYQVKATSVPYQFNNFYETCAPGIGILDPGGDFSTAAAKTTGLNGPFHAIDFDL